MTDTRSHAGIAPPSIRDRPGLRVLLLSLAWAIVLLGAAAAGAYGYVTMTAG